MTQGLSDDTVIHFEWCACVTAPPVPQEAAPCYVDDNNGATVHRGGCGECPPATAPDEAMRVAEEYWPCYWGKIPGGFTGTERAAQQFAAALIRQAGSERERELANALNNALYVMNSRPQQGWDKWRNAVAEAERLLGGESK